jgi:methionyl aminopeptidase
MIVKSAEEIENLRVAGKMLAEVLRELAAAVATGVKTSDLDLKAESEIRKRGCIPAFLGYKPEDAAYPFPATLCVSVSTTRWCTGSPREEKVIQEGDLVMLDLGLSYNGYFADAANDYVCGPADKEAQRLIDATREAISRAVEMHAPGNTVPATLVLRLRQWQKNTATLLRRT